MPLTLNEELTYLPGGFFACHARAPYELTSINRTLLSLSHTQSAEQFAALTGGTLTGLVHTDDRERIEVALKAGEAFFGAHTDALTFRLNTTDAAIRYVSCYTNTDTEGELLYGFLADVTVQREEHLDVLRRKDLYHDLYRKIRLSEERFRFISSFAGVMFYEYDLSSRESSKFENSLDVLGYTEWEMQQIFSESKTTDCLRYLMTDEDYDAISDFYNRFNENGEAEGELRIRRKDGSYHWFYDKRCLVLSQSGEGSFIRGCLWNADTTHQRISGLVESSERDGVTGLYNKSSGFAAIEGYLREKGTENTAFVLFDVDKLKLVNDTLGYQVGDALLHLVGTELVRAFGQSGVVGRFGGGEFFAFLHSAGEQELVIRKIKRLFSTLKGARQLAELGGTLSLSAGAVFPSDEETTGTLLEKAKRALYGAKLRGQGQCCVYETDTPRAVDGSGTMGLAEKKEFIHGAHKRLEDAPKERSFVILSVRIENFALFNEWFGARLGDKYVAELSYALSELEAEHDALVSYFGEDGFGILVPEKQELVGTLEGRLVGLSKSLSGTVAFLPAIGVCPIREGEASVGTALAHADEAAKSVCGSDHCRVAYYKAPPALSDVSQKELLVALRDGIRKQELVPYLRPVLELEGGRIMGAEVVSRWVRPDGKILDEENYLDTLKALGLTSVLRRALWEKLFSQLSTLDDEDHAKLPPVSLGISCADFRSMDVRSALDGLVEKCALSPADVCVSLSEQDYLSDEDLADAEIARLRAGGYSVFLSEVRLCYALLRRLKDLRVDGVLIPAEQLSALGAREGEAFRILESLMPLAEELSLRPIFTGVADKALADRLLTLGARTVAGDCFHPAQTVSAFCALIEKMKEK